MTFAQIPAGAAIFLDANTLIYHFANHPKFGAICTQLVKRIEAEQRTRTATESRYGSSTSVTSSVLPSGSLTFRLDGWKPSA